MGKMDDARTLAVEMAEKALYDLPAGISPYPPDLWENIEPETEEWNELKALTMPADGDEVGFQLAASSRAGFMLGVEIGCKLTERALTPFLVEQYAIDSRSGAGE